VKKAPIWPEAHRRESPCPSPVAYQIERRRWMSVEPSGGRTPGGVGLDSRPGGLPAAEPKEWRRRSDGGAWSGGDQEWEDRARC
jgi:hypothetical protein